MCFCFPSSKLAPKLYVSNSYSAYVAAIACILFGIFYTGCSTETHFKAITMLPADPVCLNYNSDTTYSIHSACARVSVEDDMAFGYSSNENSTDYLSLKQPHFEFDYHGTRDFAKYMCILGSAKFGYAEEEILLGADVGLGFRWNIEQIGFRASYALGFQSMAFIARFVYSEINLDFFSPEIYDVVDQHNDEGRKSLFYQTLSLNMNDMLKRRRIWIGLKASLSGWTCYYYPTEETTFSLFLMVAGIKPFVAIRIGSSAHIIASFGNYIIPHNNSIGYAYTFDIQFAGKRAVVNTGRSYPKAKK